MCLERRRGLRVSAKPSLRNHTRRLTSWGFLLSTVDERHARSTERWWRNEEHG